MASKHGPAVILLSFLLASMSLVAAHIYSQETGTVTQTISNKPHYYVSQLSNIDALEDKGTHSNFTGQQHGPDSAFDTLVEAGTGGGSASFGSSTGTGFTVVAADRMYGSVFTSPADDDGAALQNVAWYGRGSSGSGDAKAILVLHSTLQIVAVSDTVVFTTAVAERTCVFTSPPTLAANTEYVLMMIFSVPARLYYSVGNPNQGHRDATNDYSAPLDPADATHSSNQYRLRATYTIPPSFELDLEVQWSNVDFGEANEELCIYGGMMGPESLGVDVWTGSSWQNVIAGLASGWNNVTVSSYLSSSTLTVRFRGTLETADKMQSIWEIDVAVLHLWSS